MSAVLALSRCQPSIASAATRDGSADVGFAREARSRRFAPPSPDGEHCKAGAFSRIEGTYLAVDTCRMTKPPESPKPISWNLAHSAVLPFLGLQRIPRFSQGRIRRWAALEGRETQVTATGLA
jgi:hypothetical protein